MGNHMYEIYRYDSCVRFLVFVLQENLFHDPITCPYGQLCEYNRKKSRVMEPINDYSSCSDFSMIGMSPFLFRGAEILFLAFSFSSLILSIPMS